MNVPKASPLQISRSKYIAKHKTTYYWYVVGTVKKVCYSQQCQYLAIWPYNYQLGNRLSLTEGIAQ